eukprot:9200543-Pyramimonas_sp.AAC.3
MSAAAEEQEEDPFVTLERLEKEVEKVFQKHQVGEVRGLFVAENSFTLAWCSVSSCSTIVLTGDPFTCFADAQYGHPRRSDWLHTGYVSSLGATGATPALNSSRLCDRARKLSYIGPDNQKASYSPYMIPFIQKEGPNSPILPQLTPRDTCASLLDPQMASLSHRMTVERKYHSMPAIFEPPEDSAPFAYQGSPKTFPNNVGANYGLRSGYPVPSELEAKEEGNADGETEEHTEEHTEEAVSYTHLTLPTILLV